MPGAGPQAVRGRELNGDVSPGWERSLKAHSEDEQAVDAREVRELRAQVGELVLEPDARKDHLRAYGFAPPCS